MRRSSRTGSEVEVNCGGSNAAKLDLEHGPAPFPVGSGNPATITTYDLPGDCQTESEVVTASAARAVGEKAIEDPWQVRLGDAGTGIGDGYATKGFRNALS